MDAAVIDNPLNIFASLEKRILATLEDQIAEWSACRQLITQWEDRHLLSDPPDPEKLAEHKELLQRMISFGQVFSLATSHPDFPDSKLADDVQACLWVLREKFRTWHANPLTPEQANRILAEVFPES